METKNKTGEWIPLPDFEERHDYRPEIDYKEVIDEYNRLRSEGRKSEAQEILRQQGGIISLIGKAHYQDATGGTPLRNPLLT